MKTCTERQRLLHRNARLERAERLVYLFPENFDGERFLAGQIHGRPCFEVAAVSPPEAGTPNAPWTFFGALRGHDFSVEVRPRSATIVAERFEVRRDLLLAIKEAVEGR